MSLLGASLYKNFKKEGKPNQVTGQGVISSPRDLTEVAQAGNTIPSVDVITQPFGYGMRVYHIDEDYWMRLPLTADS